MNTELTQLSLPAVMSLAQWRAVEDKARQDTLKTIRPPQERDFITAQISTYPRRLTLGVIGMLIAAIAGAFVISAGKQLISYDSVLGHLATEARLSALWVSASLIAGVGLSEIGTLLFSFAAAIFGPGLHQKAFRLTAALCAFMAILANVAVTSSYVYDGVITALLAWFMTFFVPGVVIVGALVGELLILEYLDKRREAAVDYEIARREFEGYRRSPERHPDYQRHLYLRVMEVYRRRLSSGELDNPEVARALYARDLTVFAQPNFTQLPLPAEPTVASTDE